MTTFFANLKCTLKLVGPIELKLSGSSKELILGLFSKYRHDLTPMADFTDQMAKKFVIQKWPKSVEKKLFFALCLQFKTTTPS